MNIATLKNILRYTGYKPLKLHMKVTTHFGQVKYDESFDVDGVSVNNDGEFVIDCYRSEETPMTGLDVIKTINRCKYDEAAVVKIRAAEKMLAKRLLTHRGDTVYKVDVTGFKDNVWDFTLNAEVREEKPAENEN